jgi:hypothetical protein
MGADLIFAICEDIYQAVTDEEIASLVDKYISKLYTKDPNSIRWYLEDCGICDSDPDPLENAVQIMANELKEAAKQAYIYQRRDIGTFTINKRHYIVSADMTWGDEPDGVRYVRLLEYTGMDKIISAFSKKKLKALANQA